MAFMVLLFLPHGLLAQDSAAKPEAVSLLSARQNLVGQWAGKLEYLDYQDNKWFGIPVDINIEMIEDQTTLIRKAIFDDGPKKKVYITSISMLDQDGETEYTSGFRADRPAYLSTSKLTFAVGSVKDIDHWAIVSLSEGMDDDRPAKIRETMTRDGNELTSLKEVDFTDDDKQEWFQRNRTILSKKSSDRMP
ncbi:MAG: hypothetical protein R3C03_09525 [Pirellulaceae bacterium]